VISLSLLNSVSNKSRPATMGPCAPCTGFAIITRVKTNLTSEIDEQGVGACREEVQREVGTVELG
jgi:hypothetical protein